MNKEDYVSLEVAQLLKDTVIFTNDFKYIVTEDVDKDPYGNSYEKGDISHYEFKYNDKVVTLLAPSLYATQKYLRDTYGLFIDIHFTPEFYEGEVVDMWGQYSATTNDDGTWYLAYETADSYESIINKCIEKALEFI